MNSSLLIITFVLCSMYIDKCSDGSAKECIKGFRTGTFIIMIYQIVVGLVRMFHG